MKKVLLMLILVMALLPSCGAQIDINDLPGTWQVVDFEANVQFLSAELIKAAEEEALSCVYTFTNDNNFSMRSSFISNGEGGVWSYSAEDNTIQMTYKPGGQQTQELYTVEYLNSNSMKWTQYMEGFGTLTMMLIKD